MTDPCDGFSAASQAEAAHGRALAEGGDSDGALKLLRLARESSPRASAVRFELARVLLRHGSVQAAIGEFEVGRFSFQSYENYEPQRISTDLDEPQHRPRRTSTILTGAERISKSLPH